MIKRFLFLIPLWLGISFVVFIFLQMAPSDPAEILLRKEGIDPTPEALVAKQKELGLHESPLLQYGRWLVRVIRFDLGTSYRTGEAVTKELSDRLPATLELTLISFMLIVLFALAAGLMTSLKSHGVLDRIGLILTIAGTSIPSFWLGLLLIYLFSVKWGWFPVMGRGNLFHLVLPALTLSFGITLVQARLLRTSLQEILNQNFITVAMAKGVSRSRILLIHALPNALLPFLTTLGMTLGRLLAGAVIVETLFSWPGIGRLAVEAILQRDYPVIQGYILFTAFLFLLINLCVDIGYRLLDPRIESGSM